MDEHEEETPPAVVLHCHICDEDHMTRDCPQFGEKVESLRSQGCDSLIIASRLKIRLADVPVDVNA